MKLLFVYLCLFLSGAGVFFPNEIYGSPISPYSAVDESITKTIKKNFKITQGTENSRIAVVTRNGVVRLKGVANNPMEAMMAIQIAQATQGVTEVNTAQLRVQLNAFFLEDLFITGKVKGILMKHGLLKTVTEPSQINLFVQTDRGIVFLSGDVDTVSQKEEAEHLARTVKGVLQVYSYIHVPCKNKKVLFKSQESKEKGG